MLYTKDVTEEEVKKMVDELGLKSEGIDDMMRLKEAWDVLLKCRTQLSNVTGVLGIAKRQFELIKTIPAVKGYDKKIKAALDNTTKNYKELAALSMKIAKIIDQQQQ